MHAYWLSVVISIAKYSIDFPSVMSEKEKAVAGATIAGAAIAGGTTFGATGSPGAAAVGAAVGGVVAGVTTALTYGVSVILIIETCKLCFQPL